MEKEFYSRDTIDEKFERVHDRFSTQDKSLEKILVQTTAHNGRMKKTERILLIVGCITGTLLIVSGSSFAKFIMDLIL